MGFDCYNYFPEGVKRNDVIEFLELLGYISVKRTGFDKDNKETGFRFFDSKAGKYYQGVWASVSDSPICEGVYTRTNSGRSKGDADYHNYTLKQLKKRFGGFFQTDFGKDRYMATPSIVRVRAELGCYASFANFHNSLFKINTFLYSRDYKSNIPLDDDLHKYYPWFAEFHPEIISNNIIIPFLVSSLEDYFKSTYVSLLKYSDKKLSVFKSARIMPEELLSISNNELTVEMAITKTMSFQNISKTCSYFRDLDSRLDIAGTLKKPYRRRKKTLYETLNDVLEQRHLLIHKNIVIPTYTAESVKKDVTDIKSAVERVYDQITNIYGWEKR